MYLLLAFLFMAGVGWAQAEKSPEASITSELVKAKVGEPIIFGVTTTTGTGINTGEMVRVKLSLVGETVPDLATWNPMYYETAGSTEWTEWQKEEGSYLFGPSQTGFPFMTATSYFQFTPAAVGSYKYKLEVVKWNNGEKGDVIEDLTKETTVIVGEANTCPYVQAGTNINYASLYTAVMWADAGSTIHVPAGNFDLKRGTEMISDPETKGEWTGWYLPITKPLTIQGAGSDKTILMSSTVSLNNAGDNNQQDFICIFPEATGTVLKDMEIICKTEANKAIHVFGKDFTMTNVVLNPAANENFAGSVYFHSGNEEGSIKLDNVILNKGRIAFSGTNKANVNLQNITIDYRDVVIPKNVIATDNLQDYSPIGSIKDKQGLNFTVDNVTVKLAATQGKYQLDDNTIPNLPANTTVELANGNYTLTKPLILDKSLTLTSSSASSKATLNGYISITAEDVTVKDINLSYERKSSLFSDKNGISVFANKATLTGNTFTTIGDGTNGIVFYPKGSGAVAQEYTVTGNTFNLNGASSTGIIVRENFKSNSQIPDIDATASLSNGSALDQQIMATDSKNTYSNMTGGYYVRVTGNYSEADVTNGGSENITQKYLYSYVGADAVADAIALSQMGATVNAPKVASSDLANKLNALNPKPAALAAAVKILCSGNETVYTDLASALATPAVSKYLAKQDDGSYELKTPEKATPTITETDKPKASDIEVGQPLSVSLLSGGSAKVGDKAIAGVFSWKEPNVKATKESEQYDVLFTPIDQTQYTTATTKVTVKAIQYYIVTAGKCENGKVEITGTKASNKYIKDTTLTVKAIPAEHYQFDNWKVGSNSYKVTADASLEATFKAITHKVTFEEGITVLNAGTAIKSGADVAEGSVLTVTASKDGNKLTSLTSNKKNIINNQVVVDGALNIEATFEALPASTRLVKVDYSDANTQNGKVQLFDKDGNIIESGSAVAVDNTVSVVAVPDYGFKAGDLTVTGDGVTLSGSKFTVTSNVGVISIKQKFDKKTFKVTLPTEGTDHAKVAIEGSSNLDAVPFDTELTINSASASTGYKLISIIVNGKEVAVGGKFKVYADTKVNAVVEKLPEIQFTDIEQTCTYNENVQAFVVRTVPAGISGITLSYKWNNQIVTDPKNVGTYDVYASYVGTDYAGIDKKIGTLTIEKAEWTGVAIPEATDVKERIDVNQYYWGSTVGDNFQEAYYKLPSELSNNYNDPKFIIPQVDKVIEKITLMQETPQKRSIVLKSASSMTFNGKYGSIEIYNGPVKVGENAYEGQTLTLKAIPEAGYSSIPKWKSEGTTVTDNLDGTATVIIAKDAKVTAEFAEKQEASITTGKTALRTYNGVAYGSGNAAINLPALIDSKVKGWSLAIRQNGLSVDQPINAGTYDIVASRQEDEAYAATSITIGTLSIAKATPVLTDVKGSDIIAGQTLRESVLSGTSNVQGTFSWKNPDTQMNTVNASQKAIAIFKSDDSNYTDKEVEATLNVMAKSESITTRTLTLTVNNPENGKPVVTTLNGTPFTGSISVKKDDVLKVTFEANNNCTASATINGTTYTSGSTYTIGDTGNVEVVVTFTKNSTPDTDPDEPSSQPIAVTGVSLDTTDKTLAINETLILGATVKPANADNKDVRWSSSDATVASVDQDGKVKALKAGTCTITVTTDDGNFTATCKITVTTATGIDDILAVNRVYSQNGQIVIEPMYQPEVWITDLTGRIMYHNRIAEKTQVAASAGIYLVRLSESGKSKTIKVIVK